MKPKQVVIIGAGLAGMSLADRLCAASFADVRVTVLDGKPAFREDRTWCRFDTADHPYQDAEIARWTQGTVADRKTSAEIELCPPYQLLSSAAVYRSTCARIDRADHVELSLGEAVASIQADGDKLIVHTACRSIAADWVFDSRPASSPDAPLPACLVQRFFGQWIVTPAATFDPSRMTLMHFIEGPGRWPYFMYVLPIDAKHALVEATLIAPTDTPLPDAPAIIRRWLRAQHGIDVYAIEREEAGAIALNDHTAAPSEHPCLVPLGLRAGHVRASTGYAFDAIQRASDATAKSLLEALETGTEMKPIAHPISRFARWLDRVFLDALAARPSSASAWFMTLFQRVPSAVLIGFLTDTGGWRSYATVIHSLPPCPFVKAAMRTWRAGTAARHRA